MSVSLEIPPYLEAYLRGAAIREGLELDAYLMHLIAHICAVDAAATPAPRAEPELLEAINHPLPDKVWERYQVLTRRRKDGVLTLDEHPELCRLSDEVEEAHARRLQNLLELARVRGVAPEVVMAELGVRGQPRA